MSTMFYVALLVPHTMFILLALAEIKTVLLQILDEIKKARRS